MLSHKHKCIYIHIPKTAGVSIITFLGLSFKKADQSYQSYSMPFQPDEDKFNPSPPHRRVGDYVKCGFVTQDEFDSYFKFTFVRNPWDRIVSEYKHRRYSKHFDFKTFLFKCFPQPDWRDEYCHVIPQYDFIHDAAGNLLVNFVGKLERLDEDFKVVCQNLGIAPASLPHLNKSDSISNQLWLKAMSLLTRTRRRSIMNVNVDRNRNECSSYWYPRGLPYIAERVEYFLSIKRRRNTFRHYTEYYDNESREFVAMLYQKDIKTFGYKFNE